MQSNLHLLCLYLLAPLFIGLILVFQLLAEFSVSINVNFDSIYLPRDSKSASRWMFEKFVSFKFHVAIKSYALFCDIMHNVMCC